MGVGFGVCGGQLDDMIDRTDGRTTDVYICIYKQNETQVETAAGGKHKVEEVEVMTVKEIQVSF